MIEAQGLTRYYGDFPALQGATFSIEDREIVGFLGLNGAGKSTMLRILAGLLLPSSGKVTIGGLDATVDPDALRRKVGFLPEDPPLYREMRVREFLLWCGRIKGMSPAAAKRELPRALATCQLEDVAHRVIDELSHGYRKRVGIAQAIIHQPGVVVLDEPISGLDPQQIVEMRAVVRSLKKQATVLISSHILSEIAQTCDRILVIHQGRLVAEGSEAELGKRLGEGTRLKLLLRGSRDEVEALLSGSDVVASHDIADGDDDLVEATVALTGDHREMLVAKLVEAGLGVRTVQDAVSELEQIFLQFTRTEAALPEAASPAASPKVKA
jgi:ABC-2 type transport system ATP-binding protein